MEREVIRIEHEGEKPVEFTHVMTCNGWIVVPHFSFSLITKVVFLGIDPEDGEMFAGYFNTGQIAIYKGHLNRGKY